MPVNSLRHLENDHSLSCSLYTGHQKHTKAEAKRERQGTPSHREGKPENIITSWF